MKKALLICLVLASPVSFVLGYTSYSQAQIQTQQLKGVISEVNFVGSTVTVRYQGKDGKFDEIKLQINSHTKINKADLRLSLTDIAEGDEVAVEYYSDPLSFTGPVATQISLKPLNTETGSY